MTDGIDRGVDDLEALARTLSPVEALSIVKCLVEHTKKVSVGLSVAAAKPAIDVEDLARLTASLAACTAGLDIAGAMLMPGVKLDHSACPSFLATLNRLSSAVVEP